eukprot:CAMPEP_0196662978 /NCGR_PEP_ID=MMETSP1086-20130531/51107_1 /TAXON_ID=77921 /ORGANISM="Cyanoptyche  gloeocystis , Strain SAG4.97" /LENGTH=175 /DNA_ID=CAMNT_0041998621 /DNA_START=289 /DNA_END=816 /DNA_ORIENTATION=+
MQGLQSAAEEGDDVGGEEVGHDSDWPGKEGEEDRVPERDVALEAVLHDVAGREKIEQEEMGPTKRSRTLIRERLGDVRHLQGIERGRVLQHVRDEEGQVDQAQDGERQPRVQHVLCKLPARNKQHEKPEGDHESVRKVKNWSHFEEGSQGGRMDGSCIRSPGKSWNGRKRNEVRG